MKISLEEALNKLQMVDSPFTTLFTHGTLAIEIYKPDKVDLQQPHSRDEAYIVATGRGTFYTDGQRMSCKAGDFLFVAAGVEHRFEDFSDDFSTWVIFYGPEGGEKA